VATVQPFDEIFDLLTQRKSDIIEAYGSATKIKTYAKKCGVAQTAEHSWHGFFCHNLELVKVHIGYFAETTQVRLLPPHPDLDVLFCISKIHH